ncbi:MAG: hypothetical protein RRY22_04190 [Bacilli bacterium]
MTDKEIFDYLGEYYTKHIRTKNGLFIYGKTYYYNNKKQTHCTYISNLEKDINFIKELLELFILEQK